MTGSGRCASVREPAFTAMGAEHPGPAPSKNGNWRIVAYGTLPHSEVRAPSRVHPFGRPTVPERAAPTLRASAFERPHPFCLRVRPDAAAGRVCAVAPHHTCAGQ